jgi:vacuolar-type H+-ATPase subunit C/Vma6
VSSRADFVAGNTRLRARLPALLGRTEYRRLAGMPREAALERLVATTYGPYLTTGQTDGRLILGAVGRRLRDLLRGVPECYVGTAHSVVGILLARHDLRDVLALLRGARTGQPAPARLAAVMGVGALDVHAAAELAATDGPTTILRLAAQHLPDPITARALPPAWDRYELNSDEDEFEATIASSAADGWTAELKRVGRAARPVLDLVRAESDRVNLVAILRDTTGNLPHLLPFGLLTLPALLAARGGDHTRVLAARPNWREALAPHSRQAELPTLEWDLDVTLWRQAVRDLRRGDPLGADVPVGYVVAAECEARAVRLLLAGATPGHDVQDLLLG